MAPRDALIQHMVDELESLGRGLTKWEEEFVHDISHRIKDGPITEGQFRKLKEIYEAKVP